MPENFVHLSSHLLLILWRNTVKNQDRRQRVGRQGKVACDHRSHMTFYLAVNGCPEIVFLAFYSINQMVG